MAIPYSNDDVGNPLVRVRSAQEVLDEREQMANAQYAEENPATNAEPVSSLAAYVNNLYITFRDHRRNANIDDQMISCLRAIDRVYDTEVAQAIAARGGSDIYMGITGVKARAAIAWLLDIFSNEQDKTWGLRPTPIPSLSPMDMQVIAMRAMEALQQLAQAGQQITQSQAEDFKKKLENDVQAALVQEAQDKAAKMELQIHDQMVEGGWTEAFVNFVMDVVMNKCGIIKGPIIRMRDRKKWNVDDTGNASLQLTREPIITFERISPFNAFPSPTAVGFETDFIELQRLTRSALADLVGLPGYDNIAITLALEDFDKNAEPPQEPVDRDRDVLEDRDTTERQSMRDTVEAKEAWLTVGGQELLDEGVETGPDGAPISAANVYDVCVITVGERKIYFDFNRDPLRRKPYYKMGWSPKPGSFWYDSVFDLMKELQDLANASMRSLVNNLAVSCLTGDTIVYRHERKSGGKPRKYGRRDLAEVTLNQLWAQKSNHNSGLRRNVLRSLDESTGKFFGNRVVDIFDNGVAPVYRVTTTNGYTIKATMNHRFLSESGSYKLLEQFAPGDLIAVNGSSEKHACLDCGGPVSRPTAARCRKCASQFGVSAWNQKQAKDALDNRDVSGTTARGRKLVQICKGLKCSSCGTSERLQIHHVDKDPLNCKPENLLTVCEPCHIKIHMRIDNYGDPFKHVYLDFDRIESIVYVGEERVFDLQMTAPNHNFVANGFVSHNSGPQVYITDINRLPPGEDVTQIFPMKIWQFTNRNNSTLPPVSFFQPSSNAPELLKVYDRALQMADDWTGIPAYAYGNDQVAGAGRTASGLSMLMGNAAKGIKRVILSIDKFVLKPLIERMYDWNMEFNPDPAIKGDLQVEATGAVAIMVKEQMAERRIAFLQATNNPADLQIMGTEGRGALLREAAKSLELAGQKIVQDPIEIEKKIEEQKQAEQQAQQEAMQMQQAQMQAELQIKQAEVQIKQQQLQLESARLQNIEAPVASAKVASARTAAEDAAMKNHIAMRKDMREEARPDAGKA